MPIKIKNYLLPLARRLKVGLRKHLFLVSLLSIGLYLLLLQTVFLFSGDTWAESFAEYLHETLMVGWKDVFAPSWAGYLTVIPSALSAAFVSSGLPLGLVDYYFRAAAILFAALSASFVALRWNRKIIKSDTLRVLLAVFLVALFSGVSDFSFINVWYMGFIPIIFICLNPALLTPFKQVCYVLFSTLVVLTKPSIVLAPFVVYRMFKTKQYVSNIAVLLVISLQTYMLLFAGPPAMQTNVTPGATEAFMALFVGAGISVLKFLSIFPSSMWFVIGANLLLGCMFWYVAKKRNIWMALALAAALIVAVYAQYMAPGEYLYRRVQNFAALYNFDLKLQRDLLINSILVICLALLIPSIAAFIKQKASNKYLKYALITLLCSGLFVQAVRIYHPMDARQAMDISPFRHSLTMRQPLCIPLPTPKPGNLDPEWYFQDGGICITPQKNQKLHPSTIPVHETVRMRVEGLGPYPLKSILMPLYVPDGVSGTVTIRDTRTGQAYAADVHKSKEEITPIAFNTAGMAVRDSYEFEVTSTTLELAHFSQGSDTGQPAYYAYFMMPEMPKK